ncbi:MAG: hypothetical protein AAGA20_23865 [Planctomycetota bacterium]
MPRSIALTLVALAAAAALLGIRSAHGARPSRTDLQRRPPDAAVARGGPAVELVEPGPDAAPRATVASGAPPVALRTPPRVASPPDDRGEPVGWASYNARAESNARERVELLDMNIERFLAATGTGERATAGLYVARIAAFVEEDHARRSLYGNERDGIEMPTVRDAWVFANGGAAYVLHHDRYPHIALLERAREGEAVEIPERDVLRAYERANELLAAYR